MGAVFCLFICEFFLSEGFYWWTGVLDEDMDILQVSFCFLRVEGVIINIICLFVHFWVVSNISGFCFSC